MTKLVSMKIVVITNEHLKEELSAQGLQETARVEWINNIAEADRHPDADAYVDLLFENNPGNFTVLKSIMTVPVIINDVNGILDEYPENFIRINGWNSFLKRPLIEASAPVEAFKQKAENVFALFSKKTEWTGPVPGFVSARVIAAIINEAYFALMEGVSTKQEIDTAMKLGTNYPFGPFEWSEKIGIQRIYALLKAMSKTQTRYEPSALLKKEALG